MPICSCRPALQSPAILRLRLHFLCGSAPLRETSLTHLGSPLAHSPADTNNIHGGPLTERKVRTMSDLKSKRLILMKGWLFLLAGTLAGGLLLYENLSCRNGILLATCVWCCCRFYYFMFYVIEHYVDSDFKYASIWDFVKYRIRKK